MIVLDEHLMGLGLDREVRAWYEGQVCYITDLRPDTVIKDEAIPSLLLRERQAHFCDGRCHGLLAQGETTFQLLHRLFQSPSRTVAQNPLPSPSFISDGRVQDEEGEDGKSCFGH